MKIKAILLDMDGVLIDSNEFIIKLYQETAKALELKIPSDSEIRHLFGKTKEEILKILFPNNDLKLLVQTYKNIWGDRKFILPAFSGAIEAIKSLKNHGFKLAVVSGGSINAVTRNLKEAGYDLKIFDVLITSEETEKHKPEPEPILLACKKLNMKPGEVLYIGDSEFDFESAKNAKVNYISVLTGALNEEELKKLRVKNIINSISDLPNFLGLK
jgi:pyrophosphatase PpaX